MTTSGSDPRPDLTPATGDTASESAFDVLGPWVFLNDRVVPIREATVSVLDRGLLRGEGVFETIRTYGRRPFAVSRHIARMVMSARASGVRLPDLNQVRNAIHELVDVSDFDEARLHLTVTAGPGGPAPDPIGDPEPTFLILMGPLAPSETRNRVTAVTLPWVRHEGAALTGVKPTSYLDHLIGHKWAHEEGADEGIWTNSAGEITEATGSNLFAVIDGVVVTPPVAAGLLPGITRDLMFERCLARGLRADERRLQVRDVLGASECFLTSSTKEAVPVVRFDGQGIGDGTHTVCDDILDDWHAWVPDHIDP